jgi:alkylated DNA repair dioxygenase AlkB
VLLNYYRNERDSMGMHSDDEPELGPEPAIASVSFGAARTFILKHKRSKQTVKLDLEGGSVLLMSGNTQNNWLHGINKENQPRGPRVNLTFRYIG